MRKFCIFPSFYPILFELISFYRNHPLEPSPYEKVLQLLLHKWILSHPEARLDMNQ